MGYFDNLTSLHFHNYLDTEHFIPHLLAPHSPLRQQLVDFRLTSSKLPQKIDEVTLSFLLEPCIYADFECFTDCHILPSNRVIPNSHTWLWPTEREPDFYAAAADEPSEPAPPSLIERSHTDFDVFCSIFDYPLCDLPDHPRNPSYICPVISTSSTFSSLSSLEIAIGTNFNLVLLFSGPTLSNLKNLVLAGGSKDTTIPITNYEIMLLRRSISWFVSLSLSHISTIPLYLSSNPSGITRTDHSVGDRSKCIPRYQRCKGPLRMYRTRSIRLALENDFLDMYSRTRLRGYNHWPPLIGSTLAGFGEYMGPRLERLDLRKLVLKLCD